MTETIKKHVDNLYDHIMKAFTQRFQYDNGLPRKWTKDLNVEELYIESKGEATQLRKRFTQASDAMFTTARSEQERNSVATQIPAFMIVLLLVFAFDELVWILSNPMLFMLALMIAGIGGFLWYFELLYIVKPIFNTMLKTSVSNVHQILTTAEKKEKT